MTSEVKQLPDEWVSEWCSGGGNGVGVFSSDGAFRVGPAGPMAPVTTTWFVVSFMSNCGKNSVTGLKGSLSKSGNLWIPDLSSVLGLWGVTGCLSRWDAGGPGYKKKPEADWAARFLDDLTKLLVDFDRQIKAFHAGRSWWNVWFVVLTTMWTLLKSPVKVGVSVSVLYGGSRIFSEASGNPGGSLELGMELNTSLSLFSQMWLSSFFSRAAR